MIMITIFAHIAAIMMLTISPVGTRENPAAEKPVFSFGVVADVQYSDYDHGISRFYRSSLDKLREALTRFSADSIDFVVNLGDLIDRDMSSYEPVIEEFRASGLKTFHVAGNHDFSVKPGEKKRIPVLPAGNLRYYSFEEKGFRLIFLDGNDISTYGPSGLGAGDKAAEMLKGMRELGEQNALDWNGAIGPKQMKWFRQQLDSARFLKQKALVFCHFPVAPVNPHNLLNYNEVMNLLSEYPEVAAWMCGHNHEGNYIRVGNTHHVNFRGMVETEHENSYAIVKVYSDSIVIDGFGREPDRLLDF